MASSSCKFRFIARAALIVILSLALNFALLAPQIALAQSRGGGIRDAEIERLLRDYARPLLLAANLTPSQVGIWLINSPSLNAFVTNGQNIFFHSGLILESEDPNMVIGVMAHEIGHISGGHLARSSEAQAKAAIPSIITAILGLGTLLTGGGLAGLGLLFGGLQIGQRSYLTYSRAQEASADQTALRILDLTQQSPQGLITLMDKLAGQEILNEVNQDPYVRAHPLTRQRVHSYQSAAKRSRYFRQTTSDTLKFRHNMVRAKLDGFLNTPQTTMRKYKNKNSLHARYARTIALHRSGRLNASLKMLDSLITALPDNPWLYELKGQINFESGKPEAALPPYQRAIALISDEPLLYIGLAASALAIDQRDNNVTQYTEMAIKHLKQAIRLDSQNATSYLQLSKAYGQKQDIGRAEWALAEYLALRGATQKAKKHAKRAVKLLKQNSAEYLRARDIMQTL